MIYQRQSDPFRDMLRHRFVDWVSPICARLRLWLLVWGGPEEPRAREIRQKCADLVLVGLSLSLPWSTSVASGFAIAAFIAILPTIKVHSLIREMKRPALFLPVLLFLLAAIGMSWALGVPGLDRLHALGKMTKLLLLPLLFIHFQESPRVSWIFAAYALSNVVLLSFSFLVFVSPEYFHATGSRGLGIIVKNYIDQSQAFAYLAVALAGLSAEKLRRAQFGMALGFGAVAAAFLANLIFVNIARTAFAYLPLMTMLLIFRYVRGWMFVATMGAAAVLLLGLWVISPNLQSKIARIPGDISAYETNSLTVANDITASGAERLEFWRKAIGFIRSAPLFGHGTGSIKDLFQAEAVGKTGLESIVVANPHNQTLAVAIQWGAVGCLTLYAMWVAHLLMFRGGINVRTGEFVAWLGLLAVSQNVASSIFNSHLFDFYQGWLYVLAVGVASGHLHKVRSRKG